MTRRLSPIRVTCQRAPGAKTILWVSVSRRDLANPGTHYSWSAWTPPRATHRRFELRNIVRHCSALLDQSLWSKGVAP